MGRRLEDFGSEMGATAIVDHWVVGRADIMVGRDVVW